MPGFGTRRWSWTIPAALTALLVVAAASAALTWRVAGARAPSDGSAEAGFLRDMTDHHTQAVQMGLIVLERTDDPLVRTLAADIVTTQQGQVGQMQGWLELWDLLPTGEQPRMAWMGHPTTGPMPGMASLEEIAHLEGLTGTAADLEFLRLMIRHHQGGVPMAQAILERTDREEVRRLAESILQGQQSEVTWMEELLQQKGAATPADTPPEHQGDDADHGDG